MDKGFICIDADWGYCCTDPYCSKHQFQYMEYRTKINSEWFNKLLGGGVDGEEERQEEKAE